MKILKSTKTKLFLVITTILLLNTKALAQNKSQSPDFIWEFTDRFVYTGINLTGILPDKGRKAVAPLYAVGFYWGSDWNQDFGFEGGFYSYRFKEDLTKRANPTDGVKQRDIYTHIGLRLRMINYFTDRKTQRIRPLYNKESSFVPYYAIGLSLEPTFISRDPEQKKEFDDISWGAGFNEALGVLHLFRGSNFRLRYEIGMNQLYNNLPNQGMLPFLFNDFFIRVGFEYSFSLAERYKASSVRVFSSFDLRASSSIEDQITGGVGSEEELSELDRQYSGSTYLARQNIAEVNRYVFYFSGSQLRTDDIIKIQQLINSYYTDNNREHYYYIKGIAPYKPGSNPRMVKRAEAVARNRSFAINDFLVNGGIKENFLNVSWNALEAPENTRPVGYESWNYVIVREYIYEPNPTQYISGNKRIIKQSQPQEVSVEQLKGPVTRQNLTQQITKPKSNSRTSIIENKAKDGLIDPLAVGRQNRLTDDNLIDHQRLLITPEQLGVSSREKNLNPSTRVDERFFDNVLQEQQETNAVAKADQYKDSDLLINLDKTVSINPSNQLKDDDLLSPINTRQDKIRLDQKNINLNEQQVQQQDNSILSANDSLLKFNGNSIALNQDHDQEIRRAAYNFKNSDFVAKIKISAWFASADDNINSNIYDLARVDKIKNKLIGLGVQAFTIEIINQKNNAISSLAGPNQTVVLISVVPDIVN